MFGFHKHKKRDIGEGQEELPGPAVTQKMTESIHTMPRHFYLEKEKASGNKKKIVIVIIIVMVGLVVMSVASVLIYRSMKAKVEINNAGLGTQEPGIEEENKTSAEQGIDDDVKTDETQVEDEETRESPSPQAQEKSISDDKSVEIEPSKPPTPQIIVTGAADLDEDGLTLNEEKIYSTDPGKADTDNDTYLDGEEILNLFSPTQAGQRLADSRLVEVYQDSQYGFQLYYPASWLLSQSVENGVKESVFNSKVGEIIKLKIMPLSAANATSLDQYALQDNPTLGQGDLVQVAKEGFSGLKTSDGMKYYFAAAAFTESYVFTYEPVDLEYKNFMATFEMMVRSFGEALR